MLLAVITFVSLGKLLTFLALLSVLVVLHELGHFIVARLNRVHINEFAVGMGPKLFSWRSPRTGTQYSLRALPVGGYIAMLGEDGKTSEAKEQREYLSHPTPSAEGNFQAKSAWQRLSIIVAGPVANFVLAYIILLVGAVLFGVESSTLSQPVLGQVVAGMPAQLHGMRIGDRVVALNGVSMTSGDVLISRIHGLLGKIVTVAYTRDGVRSQFRTKTVPCPGAPQQGCIGFNPAPAYAKVPLSQAIVIGTQEYGTVVRDDIGSIGMLVSNFTKYSSQISGPIGIGAIAFQVQDFGAGPYFFLAALISFALGVTNLLPIPALDGGRGVLVIIEMLRGKSVDPRREGVVHFIGFAMLLVLLLLVSVHDIAHIFGKNQ